MIMFRYIKDKEHKHDKKRGLWGHQEFGKFARLLRPILFTQYHGLQLLDDGFMQHLIDEGILPEDEDEEEVN